MEKDDAKAIEQKLALFVDRGGWCALLASRGATTVLW